MSSGNLTGVMVLCVVGSIASLRSAVFAESPYVGDTIPITNSPIDQRNPSIDGDVVVWEDYRSGEAEIYGLHLSTGQTFPVAVGGNEKFYPQINGKYVTWFEMITTNSRQIFTKNLDTGEVHTVIDNAKYVDESHSVVNDKVYFSAELQKTNSVEIFSFDLNTGERKPISTSDDGDDRFPNADGKYLAWENVGVKYSDLTTGEVTTVPTDGEWREPVVSDNLIVAVGGGSNSGSRTIRAYDPKLHAFLEIESTPGHLTHPAADGRFVAWIDYDALPGQLVGHDLLENETFDIVSDQIVYQGQKSMDLDAGRIVWTRTNSDFSRFDIYLTQLLPEPSTILLGAGGCIWMLISRRRRSHGVVRAARQSE